MSQATAFPITTEDGVTLTGTLFDSGQAGQTPVLLAGALGVPQRFYAPFAQFLSEQGFVVLIFDVRGIGESRQPGASLRHTKATLLSWAEQDFGAASRALCAHTGSQQAVVLGHSLGAHHAIMAGAAVQARIARLVSVAAGAGYWRDWAAPSRSKAPLMLHLAGPLLTPLWGYFPGKRLGMVGDLPAGVMRQWSRWCRHPHFAWGAEPDLLLPRLATARFPIHAIGFSDDEAMTGACSLKLLAATPHAPSVWEPLTPHAMGLPRIGHVGAFRAQAAPMIWPLLAQRLRGVPMP